MCVGFLESLCDGDGGRRWQFIGGRGDRAGALPRWLLWLQLLYCLLCLVFRQKNDSWVVLDSGSCLVSGDIVVDQII